MRKDYCDKCDKEINCGWGQNYDNSNMQLFPCDKNKYNGEFTLRENEVEDE